MTLSRRRLLTGALALGATQLTAPIVRRAGAQPRFTATPFTLGVASGYPTADGVVLWTRLAPDAARRAAGMPPRRVSKSTGKSPRRAAGAVVAAAYAGRDARVGALRPRRRRRARARPLVLVSLPRGRRGEPGRPHAHGAAAATRRPSACASRSPPASSTSRATSRAYHHMAREDLDLVVHLGDYIYESSWGRDHVRTARGRRAVHARRLPRTATRSTRATPTSRPRTPRSRGSSRGTITRSTTTTRTTARRISHPRECSSRGAPPPTRRTTSTCRCAGGGASARARHAALPRASRTATSRSSSCSTRASTARTRCARARPRRRRPSARTAPSGWIPRSRCSARRRSSGCTRASAARARAGTSSRSRR